MRLLSAELLWSILVNVRRRDAVPSAFRSPGAARPISSRGCGRISMQLGDDGSSTPYLVPSGLTYRKIPRGQSPDGLKAKMPRRGKKLFTSNSFAARYLQHIEGRGTGSDVDVRTGDHEDEVAPRIGPDWQLHGHLQGSFRAGPGGLNDLVVAVGRSTGDLDALIGRKPDRPQCHGRTRDTFPDREGDLRLYFLHTGNVQALAELCCRCRIKGLLIDESCYN